MIFKVARIIGLIVALPFILLFSFLFEPKGDMLLFLSDVFSNKK
ncbi:hypothetical protein [Heyndrickxia vini]|nr:hypothetical protein [Heyndrickxia vini]